jgi:hypothetical protein
MNCDLLKMVALSDFRGLALSSRLIRDPLRSGAPGQIRNPARL